MNLKAVIIDDESAARSLLSSLIKNFINDVTVIGTADSAINAIKLLKKVNPDILFLDIEMPGGNGFDFLQAIDRSQYKIIFTTAHKEFALDAFKHRVDGYLLKPIDIDDLEDLIATFKQTKTAYAIHDDTKRIAFKTQESIEYVAPNEIIRVEGDGNYCTIYIKDNKKIVISKNMKQLEEALNQSFFIKTHKSFLVNINCIIRYIKTEGGHFEMIDGASVPVSRRKKDEILKTLESQAR